MKAENKWELFDGHLFQSVLLLLTIFTVQFLIGSQLFWSCEEVQATYKRFIWLAGLTSKILSVGVAGTQVKRNVHTRIMSCWRETAWCTSDVRSQEPIERPMSNTLAISIICLRNASLAETKKRRKPQNSGGLNVLIHDYYSSHQWNRSQMEVQTENLKSQERKLSMHTDKICTIYLTVLHFKQKWMNHYLSNRPLTKSCIDKKNKNHSQQNIPLVAKLAFPSLSWILSSIEMKNSWASCCS